MCFFDEISDNYGRNATKISIFFHVWLVIDDLRFERTKLRLFFSIWPKDFVLKGTQVNNMWLIGNFEPISDLFEVKKTILWIERESN